jgi:hypothetical protein
MRYYILDDDLNHVPCNGPVEYGKWLDAHPRDIIIGRNNFKDIAVSTVFLGLDLSIFLYHKSEPVLYETMIFGGKNDEYQERYCTREQAIEGHMRALDLVRKELGI